jgi:hypothetical protein
VVGGEVEHGKLARELVAPERGKLRAARPAEQFALPPDVIRVNELGCGQRRVRPRNARRVERAKFFDEYSQRPEVDDDVVSGDQQQPRAAGRVEEADAEDRAAFEIEGPSCLFADTPVATAPKGSLR